jgi:signal transduction histidine kinase
LKRFISDTIYRHAYLLIISAWLFTLSFVFSNYLSFNNSPQGVRRLLQRHIELSEKDLASLLEDTARIGRFLRDAETEQDVLDLTSRTFGVFLYDVRAEGSRKLVGWNTQQSIPNDSLALAPAGAGLVKLSNGYFDCIRREMIVGGRRALVCALIPVRWDYFIENDYLRKGFAGAPGAERYFRITADVRGLPVLNTDGKVLYRFEPIPEAGDPASGWPGMLLRLIGTLFILFWLHLVAIGVHRHFGTRRSIIFLVSSILILRGASYLFPFPIDFRRYELFNPVIYGSSPILKSLGDVLINALLFAWIMLFVRSITHGKAPVLEVRDRRIRMPLSIIFSGALVAATWSAGNTIRSLIADSAISYEVTSFFKLDAYTAVGFFVMGCVSLGYFILSHLVYAFMTGPLRLTVPVKALLSAAVGLTFILLFVENRLVGFGVGLLLWLQLYLWLTKPREMRADSRISGGATVFWLLFFSMSITLVIFTENRTRERGFRRAAAEKLAMQTDPSSDFLINIATIGIPNTFLRDNLPRFREDKASATLKDSLIESSFRGYRNKFETRLFMFDSAGMPLSATDRLTFDTLNTIYTMNAEKTSVPGMRYFSSDMTSFSYIFRRMVTDSADHPLAVFYMLSTPREFREEALYPELVRSAGESSGDGLSGYSYAVYNSLQLRMHRNEFPFPISLETQDIPSEEFEFRKEGEYDVLWFRAASDKVVLVARKRNVMLEGITLFAYIFCASLLLVALFQLASFSLRLGQELWGKTERIGIGIGQQIQGTVIFISIFTFLVIGAVTIVLFINRYDRNNREKLGRTLQLLSDELHDRMRSAGLNPETDVLMDSAYDETLHRVITELSAIHDADINLYDDRGNLRISSQPFVYNEGILSRKMDPVAYWQMKRRKRVQFVQNERYGQLEYISIYSPFRNRQGELSAYVNIPYFASTRGLKQEISSFLVALINLNTFVFLIGGIISVLLTQRLTRSFTWIGRKMLEISLSKHNQEIVWHRKDEIGVLVAQYNRMVRKLEESATALARTEREGAWREMARQVAHEIKNPLTPMKLSIQYLQKAIHQDSPQVPQLASRVSATLIEQIEHLSRIAADFSEFANIGSARQEDFDLHDTIRSVADLHAMNEAVRIESDLEKTPLIVHADRTQMNRLFSNLLQNAVEAIPDRRQGIVRISESRSGSEVIISIIDNGSGIPEALRSNIFSPNFTTKSSGTGLGLAMCKSIVEQQKGTIDFETETGKGTTFRIRLPLNKS